ncbi:MAG: hypothetical protein KAT70_07035, partial [Thermoplasmata archaeon]|nr:hypothetical protein [Thermoplasmata archaeon]
MVLKEWKKVTEKRKTAIKAVYMVGKELKTNEIMGQARCKASPIKDACKDGYLKVSKHGSSLLIVDMPGASNPELIFEMDNQLETYLRYAKELAKILKVPRPKVKDWNFYTRKEHIITYTRQRNGSAVAKKSLPELTATFGSNHYDIKKEALPVLKKVFG